MIFNLKKEEIFSSRHNYRPLNWSPTTKLHEVRLWTYLNFILCLSSLSTLSFCWKNMFYRHTVKGGLNYWSTFIDCRLPFRIAAYPMWISKKECAGSGDGTRGRLHHAKRTRIIASDRATAAAQMGERNEYITDKSDKRKRELSFCWKC